ncbi:uncharacterized protein LOC142493289 isoform X1 [Ascaphus truei]|uniref:uncharacterized protein LOC142493289 isoform X1 n=1 Tax=Ascaphus truei TaxID=8439 RepID=UPI003F5A05C4
MSLFKMEETPYLRQTSIELQPLEAQIARQQDVENNHAGEVLQAEADFPDSDQRHIYVLPAIPDQRNIYQKAYQTVAKVITKKRLLKTILCFSICFAFLAISASVIFRLQWHFVTQQEGEIIDWKRTAAHGITTPDSGIVKRGLHYDLKPVDIQSVGIPQGVYWKPFPKPIIQKRKTLGISQVVLFDSTVLAKEAGITTPEGRKLVTQHLNAQMQQLQSTSLKYDLPLHDHWKQQSYREQRCHAEFGHCYFIDFQGTRKWPTKELKADHCPRPGVTMDNIRYKQYPIFYLNTGQITQNGFVPNGQTDPRVAFWEGAEEEEYRIPGGVRPYISAVFCTDSIYSGWWNSSITAEDLLHKLQDVMEDAKTGQLKTAALPKEWNTKGDGMLFREPTAWDTCTQPRFATFTNTTYYSHSCKGFKNACGITLEKLINEGICDKDTTVFKYGCKPCSFYYNLTQGYFNWQPKMIDQGFLHFSGLRGFWCVERIVIMKPNYKVYSLFQKCLNDSLHMNVDTVIRAMSDLMNVQIAPDDKPCEYDTCTTRNIVNMPYSEAMWGTNATINAIVYYENDTEFMNECKVSSKTSARKLLTNDDILITTGHLLSDSVSVISQISDSNDEELRRGILVLRDHMIKFASYTISDITVLSEEIKALVILNHITSIRLTLQSKKVDISLLNLTLITQTLNLSPKESEILAYVSQTTVYDIRERNRRRVRNPDDSLWEVFIYYELFIPGDVYTTNWELLNFGHITHTGSYFARMQVAQPFQYMSVKCDRKFFISTIRCVDRGYLICDDIIQHMPCNDQMQGSNFPITVMPIQTPFTLIHSLDNGSYIVLSTEKDCDIPPFQASLVTVNGSIQCYGTTLIPPLLHQKFTSGVHFQVPAITLILPHMTAYLAHLKKMKVTIGFTHDIVHTLLQRVHSELLRVDLHPGDFPQWLTTLGESLKTFWPMTGNFLTKIGTSLQSTGKSIFSGLGNAFGILGYLKPILFFILGIIILVILLRIFSFLPKMKMKRRSA